MKISSQIWILSLVAAFATLGCAFPKAYNLPPAQQLLEPGPGVGGPGPGVMLPPSTYSGMGPAGGQIGTGAMCDPGGACMDDGSGGGYAGGGYRRRSAQVWFAKLEGMNVLYDASGSGNLDSEPLICPARQNFPQDGIYRLKVTNIPGHEGVELYPTLEVGPGTVRTEAFLAHNAIPVQLTADDLDQVMAGNFVTKVIYLPDPEFQELAAGVDTLVSTRLDPGVDPITEADRRGAILAVLRVGNKDIELAGCNDDLGGVGGLPGGEGYCGPDGYGGPGALTGGYTGEGDQGYPHNSCRPHYGNPGVGYPPSIPYLAGVTAPQYGMPITGTPIGLPGPPHIPLGGPAGLNKHVMKNHTKMHLPEPTDKLKIHVRQQPGFSYPKPVSNVRIREQSITPAMPFEQPHWDKHERVGGPRGGGFGLGPSSARAGLSSEDCE